MMKFTVGRINSCYNIKDDSVDRHHCTFILLDDTWTLLNVSVTGTSINGSLIGCMESKIVYDKDVIQFGPGKKYTFMFHADRKEYEQGIKKEPLHDNNEDAGSTEKELLSALRVLKAAKRKIELLEKEALDKNKRLKALDLTVKTLHASSDVKDQLLEDKDKLIEEMTAKLKYMKTSLRIHRTDNTNLKEDVDYIANTIETELMCTICKEMMYNVVSVNCAHMFCKYCLTEWRLRNNICPLCRVVIQSEKSAVAVNSLLSKIFSRLPKKMKAARRKIIEERGGQEVEYDYLNMPEFVDLTRDDHLQNNALNGNGRANNAAVCAATVVDLTQGNDFVQPNMLADIEID